MRTFVRRRPPNPSEILTATSIFIPKSFSLGFQFFTKCFTCRHAARAHTYINLLNFFAIITFITAFCLAMIPYMIPGRYLSFSFWTPFDPKADLTFRSMYAYEAFCMWVADSYNLTTDIFVFMVFIVVNFAISLLCERIETIGAHSDARQCQKEQPLAKVVVYAELIDFIKVHYKFNQ